MSNKPVSTAKRAPRSKARKFWRMDADVRTGGAPPYKIGNEPTLAMGQLVLSPLRDRRGFPDFPEAPLILVKKKSHRPLRDLEGCRGYWLISDRAKQVFERVDPEAFAFVKCEVRFVTGEPGPDYWLCDVVRVLDALDEARSRIPTFSSGPSKPSSWTSLAFKEDIVGSAHAFRMLQEVWVVICGQSLRDACKAAGLKGIGFRDADDLWGTGKVGRSQLSLKLG
jgi:hypothetical protein